MGLRRDLQAGMLGIRLEIPARWRLEQEGPGALKAIDDEHQLMWFLFHFPGLYLDLTPSCEALWRRDVEHHARYLFEGAFARLDGEPHPMRPAKPRTADLAWSPVVSCERRELGEAAALEVVHRIHYQPGRETVMGHLLVPLAGGLFEARCVSGASQTGYRESMLVTKALVQAGMERRDEVLAGMSQPMYDDPACDLLFPQHPLSLVRAGQRWLLDEAGLVVMRPGVYQANGEVTVPGEGCAFVPPPRFVASEAPDDVKGMFVRVSFAGTDGVDRFFVEQTEERLRLPIGLRERLQRRAHEMAVARYEASGVTQIECSVEMIEDALGRPHALTVVEGDGHAGRLRGVIRWFVAADGRIWCLNLLSTVAQPRALLVDELDAVVRSWRWLKTH